MKHFSIRIIIFYFVGSNFLYSQTFTTYKKNGEIVVQINKDDRTKLNYCHDGTMIETTDSNKVISIKDFKNCKFEGKYIVFWNNAKMKIYGHCKNNKFNGIFYYYDEKGVLEKKIKYHYDKIIWEKSL